MKWKQKNGEYIDIKKMSTSHIVNTLSMITRNIGNAINRCHGFDDYFEIPEDLQQQIEEMEAELERRNSTRI